MADGIVEAFNADNFLKMIRHANTYKTTLTKSVEVYAEAVPVSKKHLAFIKGRVDDSQLPDFCNLEEAVDRCLKFIKCLAYALGVKIRNLETSSSDYPWFSAYRGKLPFEKCIHEIIKPQE